MRKGEQAAVGVAVAITGALLLFGRGRARVSVGDKITLSRVSFDCRGPDATLYIGWGLARNIEEFDNGAGLVADTWAAGGPMSVEYSVDPQTYEFKPDEDFELQPVLYLDPGAAELSPGEYDTWVWFTMDKESTNENDFIALFRQPKALTIGG